MDNNGATVSSYGYSATPSHAPVTYNGNTLDYDANGNLVDDEDFIYVYNNANQLSEVRYSGNNSLVEKYWYDANGQRIKKQNSDGEFTYYINKFYEIDNGISTSYFFRDDERVAKETSESMEWYLSDHIGSTSLMVDETGLEVERTDYFPYGQVRSGGLEKYGFTGQENDADTGLMYYGARYYSPEYRVFVQPDTMLPDPYNPQALNRYAYALNNPVKYTDPSGHYVETAIDLAFLAMDINDIRTGNADKWTYAGLGVDLVCAALPVATGGRLAVTAVEETVTHADNILDLGKAAEKSVDVVDTVADAGKAVDNIEDASAVIATKNNYRKTYLNENPNLPKGWQVHHTIPQKYESIMADADINIHEAQYLKGVEPKMHQKITNEWYNWDKSLGREPTAEEVIDFSNKINEKYDAKWFKNNGGAIDA
ncbi:hypothetical protein MSSIH_1696 [Methanosarcina siciliae HI350]|uniref:Teneurin-like YD-shell domain-containing protein n=1 Tax=Methanosarcina siciliae HI350 TaxID=1434119 RepID=A0A0E3LAP6_9EURY|nr:hypothetical protein MSSIH_1696 [Methanosarcina siciliae HI350]